MYVKITDGTVDVFPYSLGKLRTDNPQTSFPKKMSDAALQDYGIYPVTNADKPSYNSLTQKISQATTPTLVSDVWTLTWSVSDKTSDEISSDDATTAEGHRTTRNKLLADTDWTQMNDSPLSNEDKTSWATYRQELRDLSDLDAWPNLADDDWPVAP
jgi:hypothetical protein